MRPGLAKAYVMTYQRPGLPEVFMCNSSLLWWWEFLLEQCLPCFLEVGQHSRKPALHSWLQWHWTRWCKKSSGVMVWELQLQPWWRPQVNWESNSAHSFRTSVYHDKHLCSLLPASIYTYFFFINTHIFFHETVLFLVLEHRRSIWSRSVSLCCVSSSWLGQLG